MKVIYFDQNDPPPILIDFSLSLEFPVPGSRHDQVVYGSGGREHEREAVVERGEQDVHIVHVDVVAVKRQDAAAVVVRR